MTVLELGNRGLRDAAELRKRKRDCFSVNNKETHVFTTEAILREKVAREAATAARERKGMGKAAPDRAQGVRGDVGPSGSVVQPDLGDIERFQDEDA